MARPYEYFNSRGWRKSLPSNTSINSTLTDIHVQPTFTDDVQPLHPDDVSLAISKFSASTTTSNSASTCPIHTVFSHSTLPRHSITTVDFTSIHRSSFATSTKHSSSSYRLYQRIRL